MSGKITLVKCPTCRTPVEWHGGNPFRPFCSERCKLIDLGAWADEDYAVAAQEEEWLMPEAQDWQRRH